MTDQTIEIPHNTEVLITIAVNPCHCDEPVEVPIEAEPHPICDYPPVTPPVVEPDPIVVVEPIPVIETPMENPTPEVVPTSEPIPTAPELPPVEPEPIIVTEPTPVPEIPIEQPAPPVVDIPSVPEVLPSEPNPPIAETPVSPITDPVQPIPEVTPVPDPVQPAPPEPVTAPDIQPTPVVIPTPVPEPVEVIPPITPTPAPVVIPVPTPVEAHTCDCDLTSKLTLAEFTKQLIAASKNLLYPSESDFPIEVLSKGLSTKMPTIKGIEVRSLDRVFPTFLREVDPDDQQTGNVERANTAAKWQALYNLIKKHSAATAWHYPVKQNRYTHELIVIMLHPQGTVGLRIKLVET